MGANALRNLRIAGISVRLCESLPDGIIRDIAGHLAPFVQPSGTIPDLRIQPASVGRSRHRGSCPRDLAMLVLDASGGSKGKMRFDHLWLVERRGQLTVQGEMPDAHQVMMALHVGLARLLPRSDGLLLHASAVRYADRAFVFAGASGCGKTSAAAGFRGGDILADERVAVRRVNRTWLACPIPMAGDKYQPVEPHEVPVGAVVVMRKHCDLRVRCLASGDAAVRIAPAIVHHRCDAAGSARVLHVLAGLLRDVGAVELCWRIGDCFGDLLHQAALHCRMVRTAESSGLGTRRGVG